MPKFMNAELRRIQNNLVCAHCKAIFKGSESQAWKVKYERKLVCCSDACRTAHIRSLLYKPVPTCGPCPTCGQMFASRNTRKKFCSLDCYTQSEQFKNMRQEASQAARQKRTRPCPECGRMFGDDRQTSRGRKFCSTPCYRAWMAKRFDRWMANPETMMLPQSYDEFLDQEELRCLVDGCDWSGRNLSMHMNSAHGVRAREFKRAAGFNYKSGIISKPLAVLLGNRPLVGVGLEPPSRPPALDAQYQLSNPHSYRSLEGSEHHRKTRALAGNGPSRQCLGCGRSFTQSTPFGRALYCSPECRDRNYREQHRSTRVPVPQVCRGCGEAFMPRTTKRTLYCTPRCRDLSYRSRRDARQS